MKLTHDQLLFGHLDNGSGRVVRIKTDKREPRTSMPVNMDPSKRRHRRYASSTDTQDTAHPQGAATSEQKTFGEETEEDRAKALADAERKNLWDATEVIDMDTW